jgi:L-ascorbate metabolism protein UlaG (beta-lactamase superfamily)
MGLNPNATFTWYGHSVWKLTTPGGKTVLFDPWFSNPSSPMSPADVDRCDVLLVSHGHFDHFGDALMVGSRTRPVWPCIHELSLWLGRNYAHKDGLIGMNKGGTVEAAGLKVTMVRADHSSGDLYAGAESPLYLGEPVGFIVELEDGYRFYFAGDTDLFGDLRLIAERYRPSFAFLPIGGHFTMDPVAAAHADVPDPDRHARSAATGAGGSRPGPRDGPRHDARGHAHLRWPRSRRPCGRTYAGRP